MKTIFCEPIELVTDVTYNKDNGNSKIQLSGSHDNYIIIHGGNIAEILFGVNGNMKHHTIIEAKEVDKDG